MKYQKAVSAPKTFPIKRKKRKYVINPNPGPHPKDECIPLGIIIRDVLSFAETLKEAKEILNKSEVLIDGKVVKDYKYPVGIFDIIEFPKIGKYLRVVPSKKGLKLIEIKEKEKNKKLCRIENKTCLKGGKIQLNLNDGKNLINERGSLGDSLLINLDNMKILDIFKRKKNSLAMVTRGKNRGRIGKIKELEVVKSSNPNKIILEISDKVIDVPEEIVFPIGKNKPSIEVKE